VAQVSKEEMLRHFGAELQSGDAALFIGAGMSKASGFVDWRELLRDIAVDLKLDIERESDLIGLAQFHVNERQGRSRINQLLIDEFTKDATLNDNHRLIATLPVHTIWTTNYDELLETAFRDAHRSPDVKTTKENLAQTVPNRGVVIYKMHGDCRQPQDAVLTKEDYETYDVKRSVFSTALKGDLVDRTFLFLGFSFTDPNIDYILSRIRGLLGQNQRPHYCVMKWPDAPKDGKGAAAAEYEYSKRKLELRISDLSRYQIHAVMVDSYKEVTEILHELARRAHMKDVFVSGSAFAYEPFGRKRIEDFASHLGHEVIRRGFNLSSGFGLGIGGAVALGALEEIYIKNLPTRRVALFPFPQEIPGGTSREEFYSRYRKSIIGNAGFALFICGNRDESGKPQISPGVMEEFEIACKLGTIPIPVGATGWAAEQVWKEVSKRPREFFGSVDVSLELKVLGEGGHSDEEYINAVFEIMRAVAR
jgi:hypothetical protein